MSEPSGERPEGAASVDDLAAVAAEARGAITAAASLDELRDLEADLLGKRSTLSSLKAHLGSKARRSS